MPRTVNAREERFGGFFEEFETGDRFVHWPGKTITEAEDHQFCLLTMAVSPLHLDRHFAEREMPQGRNVVVGTFIYSLLLGMSVPDISGRAIANLGARELRHIKPVFHGDTLYGETAVLETRVSVSRPDTGIVTVKTTGSNQLGEIVCEFERSVLLPVRNPDRPLRSSGDAE